MPKIPKFLFAFLAVAVVLSITIWMSCQKEPQSVTVPSEMQQELSLGKPTGDILKVMEIQNRYTDALLSQRGVVGTATALLRDGEYAVKVLTKEAGVEKTLPKVLEDVPVVVEVVGEIKALTFSGRYRDPLTMGVSGGNINDRQKRGAYIICSGGTIGSVVYKNSVNYFLSNNHVFARENKASIGEDIVQPGLADVNCSQIANDVVADLSEFKSIVMKRTASNKVDAAIAAVRSGISFTATTECGYTPSSTVASAVLGLQVKKCGRTTEYTEGEVTGLNVTVLISYNSGTARFINQIQFSDMSDSGDSGSLIVTKIDNNPVALLFAGSSTTTIGNPIQEVLNAFGVHF